MGGLLVPAAILTAAACALIYRQAYRYFTAATFFYLFAASVPLAGAAVALGLKGWPPAAALADLCLAIFGMLMVVAAWQLRYAFRRAGAGDD